MAEIDVTAGSGRCFGRLKARELTPTEIDHVAGGHGDFYHGGTLYTDVTNLQYPADGSDDVTFDYGDVEP